jgi:hypothetical protein
MADKLQTEMQLHSLNAHRYTLSHPQINAAGQLTCILQNNSLDDLHFDGQTVIATAELNATSMHSQESCEEDSLDDQIISENTLFDPTALDKKFSYKDCKINPNLAPTIASQLNLNPFGPVYNLKGITLSVHNWPPECRHYDRQRRF